MTKFEAFEILFKKLSVWKMVEIYNNHFPDNNIYALTTQNINKIFANHTPYYLLQQFSSDIDIHDNWIAKDPWSLDDVWYSYSDEEITDYIEDEIVTLYQDSNCWQYIIDYSEFQNILINDKVTKIKEHFGFNNTNIAHYYVAGLKEWESDKDDEYNLQKFKSLYQSVKAKYKNICQRYVERIYDAEDFWHYSNQLSQQGYLSLDF